MILNNFINIMPNLFGTLSPDNVYLIDTTGEKAEGSSQYLSGYATQILQKSSLTAIGIVDVCYTTHLIVENSTASTSNLVFGFGNGTTAPTPEDYKFSGDNIIMLTEATSLTNSKELVKGMAIYSATVRNTADTPVTLSEMALAGTYRYSSNAGCTLLTRDVFSPITLASGEAKIFTLTIDFTKAAGTNVQVA